MIYENRNSKCSFPESTGLNKSRFVCIKGHLWVNIVYQQASVQIFFYKHWFCEGERNVYEDLECIKKMFLQNLSKTNVDFIK